jgi:hypothetical protein
MFGMESCVVQVFRKGVPRQVSIPFYGLNKCSMTFTTNRTVERGCGKAQRSAYFISNAWRVSNVLRLVCDTAALR